MPVLSRINLLDVFSVVERERYPLLWREFVKINTIFATSVSCEQSFSVVKRSFHVNMKWDTLIANVVNKFHKGEKRKDF